MKRLYIFCLLSASLALSAGAQLNSTSPWSKDKNEAQTLGLPKPPPPASSGSPTDVPLDGGLGVLLVAGALYGRKAYKRQAAAAKSAI